MEKKTGTATTYDSNLQSGRYIEDGTGIDLGFESTRPTIHVLPGDLVEILHKTPSGKVIDVIIKLNGHDV